MASSRVCGCGRRCAHRGVAAAPASAAPNNNTVREAHQGRHARGRARTTSRRCRASPTPTAATAPPGVPATGRRSTTSSSSCEAAGYSPEVQEFMFDYFEENSELIRVSPQPRTFVNGTDFLRNAFDSGTPEGTATGSLVPVGLVINPSVPAEREHQRLRGGGLRRLPGRRRRARPARHLRLQCQGPQRTGRRRQRGHRHERGPAGPHRR